MYKTEVRPSPIHGLGCFLLEPVAKGSVVWGITYKLDKMITEDELAAMNPLWQDMVLRYAYRTGKYYVLCMDDARYMNHAEGGACSLISDHAHRDVAVRDLVPGDELTCDYRTFDLDWERKLGMTPERRSHG